MKHETWSKLTGSIAMIGLIISPSALHFDKPGTQTMMITNGPKDAAHFEVYADDFESSFMISPASFDLEKGKQQQVQVTLQGKESGALSTKLSVIARPTAAGAVAFQTAMKIPLTTVRSPTPKLTASIGEFGKSLVEHWVLTLSSMLLLGCLAMLAWRRRGHPSG